MTTSYYKSRIFSKFFRWDGVFRKIADYYAPFHDGENRSSSVLQ